MNLEMPRISRERMVGATVLGVGATMISAEAVRRIKEVIVFQRQNRRVTAANEDGDFGIVIAEKRPESKR